MGFAESRLGQLLGQMEASQRRAAALPLPPVPGLREMAAVAMGAPAALGLGQLGGEALAGTLMGLKGSTADTATWDALKASGPLAAFEAAKRAPAPAPGGKDFGIIPRDVTVGQLRRQFRGRRGC